MDIRTLKYFLMIAQEESISKAAALLHTTQPNLSRQLSQLEEETGHQLVIRGPRKITLTEEGVFLRKRAQEIVGLLDRTETDLQNYKKEIQGELCIGAAESYTMRLVGQVLNICHQKYPGIFFNIFSGSTVEVMERLESGLDDFGILVGPVDLSRFNYLKLPREDKWGVIMNKSNPLSVKQSITPEDLQEEPIWLAHQQRDSNILSGWLKEDIQNLNIIGTFNLITTPSMIIDAGLGCLFTFDQLLKTEGENLCFRPLNPPLKTELYLVWHKYRFQSRQAEVFLNELSEFLKFRKVS